MKLCFVCREYPPGPHGGIGTMTQVLARALVRAGHEVRSVGLYPSWYEAPERQDDQGVQVLRLRQREHPLGWILRVTNCTGKSRNGFARARSI